MNIPRRQIAIYEHSKLKDFAWFHGKEVDRSVVDSLHSLSSNYQRLEAVAGEDITSIQQLKSIDKEVESLTEGISHQMTSLLLNIRRKVVKNPIMFTNGTFIIQ